MIQYISAKWRSKSILERWGYVCTPADIICTFVLVAITFRTGYSEDTDFLLSRESSDFNNPATLHVRPTIWKRVSTMAMNLTKVHVLSQMHNFEISFLSFSVVISLSFTIEMPFLRQYLYLIFANEFKYFL